MRQMARIQILLALVAAAAAFAPSAAPRARHRRVLCRKRLSPTRIAFNEAKAAARARRARKTRPPGEHQGQARVRDVHADLPGPAADRRSFRRTSSPGEPRSRSRKATGARASRARPPRARRPRSALGRPAAPPGNRPREAKQRRLTDRRRRPVGALIHRRLEDSSTRERVPGRRARANASLARPALRRERPPRERQLRARTARRRARAPASGRSERAGAYARRARHVENHALTRTAVEPARLAPRAREVGGRVSAH